MVYKTHRLVKSPEISARFLADYMAASDSKRRTIIRGCKYHSTARVIQHREANSAISRFLRHGQSDLPALKERAKALRDRLTDDDFDRDLLDHNADYIDRFASVHHLLSIPKADIEEPLEPPSINVSGVRLKVSLAFRLRRTTKTNEIRIGAATLRYAKGSPLPPEIAAWQAAILLGYLKETNVDAKTVPEGKLCLVIDAYKGLVFAAPSDAIRRYQYVESACATIAEHWQNIPAPPNAVF